MPGRIKLVGDFDYEELDKAIKDLYLTDDDKGENSKVKSESEHEPAPTAKIESVPAEHIVRPRHEAVSPNRRGSGKSISIMGADEELVPVRRSKSTAEPVSTAKTISVSDANKPKAKRITIDRQDTESRTPRVNSPRKISVADDSSAVVAKPHQIEHHTFELKPQRRSEVGGRGFRGNISLRNEDIDVDVKTDEELLPKTEPAPKAKPFAINKNRAEAAQSRRRSVHYGGTRDLNVQHNPQRSLSQPMPKPAAFVPHVDIEADLEPKAEKDPYEIPFLPDAKVEKRPLGGGDKVEVAVDPAIVGPGVREANGDDVSKVVDHVADVSLDNVAGESHRDETNNPSDSSIDDDFIGEFLADMKKRRQAKANDGNEPEVTPSVADFEHHAAEPAVSAAVSKVVGNSSRPKQSGNNEMKTDPTGGKKPLLDGFMSGSTTAVSRSANLNRYQTKYTPKRGGSSWGWILLFILVIIAGSFAGVALYYYGL